MTDTTERMKLYDSLLVFFYLSIVFVGIPHDICKFKNSTWDLNWSAYILYHISL